MYLCVGIVLAGLLCFGVCVKAGKRKAYSIYCYIMMLSGAIGVLVCITDTDSDLVRENEIRRPQAGSGAVEEDLVLSVEDLSIREPYRVMVENRHLTKRELEELFSQAVEELERVFLGENESFDHITHNVVPVDSVADGRVEVGWSFDDYKAVSLTGELQEEALCETGSLVQVKAVLTYENAQAEHHFSMCVYPPGKTAREQFYELLRQELSAQNGGTDEVFVLPERVAGYALGWERQRQKTHYTVLLIGLCAMAGVAVGKKEDLRKAREERNAKLLAEYPQMLSQMALLLGAGMTVNRAWERIVVSYERRRACRSKAGEELPVYEEMRITYHQIRDGVGERLAYEQFGERIGLQTYRRLATLLVQNLRKGTAGLNRLLEKEMQNAFDEQENIAKKKGEELQTKLLLPMMLMLGLVIVIIMIPAVANFQV